MKIVNIKGANGSGKTTIAKQLLAQSRKVWVEVLPDIKSNITYLDDLGWTLIGKYPKDKKMGGCDGIHTIDQMKKTIDIAMETKPDYWVLFEGAMIATLKATFYDWMLEKERYDSRVQPLFVFLDTTVENCAYRIANRGTKVSLKSTDGIFKKLQCVHRHMKVYDKKYVRVMNVDEVAEKDMLRYFLQLVGDEECLEVLWTK